MRIIGEGKTRRKFAMLRWKDSIGDALEEIDKMLKPHGLEIVQQDSGSDYCFHIEKRSKLGERMSHVE